MIQNITSICICGAGTMGSGIAQVSASGGYNTILFDINIKVLQKAKEHIHKNLEYLWDRKKISFEEKNKIFNSILFTTNVNDCVADLILEAVVESYEVKISLFNKLSALNDAECIFASNSSSLSISTIAEQIKHPNRMAGMHFFNPAPIMKLVEVIKAKQTDDMVIETLMDLALQFGKTPVLCKDVPGFIVNRVARQYYLEALKIGEEGNADFETIDSVLEATGFKMGPFRLMDLIGNDINLAVTESLYHACNQPARLKPSTLQRDKVNKGELGRKSGKGYYNYT